MRGNVHMPATCALCARCWMQHRIISLVRLYRRTPISQTRHDTTRCQTLIVHFTYVHIVHGHGSRRRSVVVGRSSSTPPPIALARGWAPRIKCANAVRLTVKRFPASAALASRRGARRRDVARSLHTCVFRAARGFEYYIRVGVACFRVKSVWIFSLIFLNLCVGFCAYVLCSVFFDCLFVLMVCIWGVVGCFAGDEEIA